MVGPIPVRALRTSKRKWYLSNSHVRRKKAVLPSQPEPLPHVRVGRPPLFWHAEYRRLPPLQPVGYRHADTFRAGHAWLRRVRVYVAYGPSFHGNTRSRLHGHSLWDRED